MNQLISQARNPTTESQQELYNEFVRNYGTSYFSSAIVGGVAHFYTFVAENYHTTSSYNDLQWSISLGVSNELSSENGNPYQEVYESLPQAFEDNSYIVHVFEPSAQIVKNESAVQ